MRKVLLVMLPALLALAMVIPALGCASEEMWDEESYVIGAIFSTTGAFSNLGVPERNTVMMMRDQINANGGINDRPLEIVFYNDESETSRCATLATRLIEQDKVLAIVGPSATGPTLGIKDIVTQAEIPLISCAAHKGIITPIEESYWVFKTPQNDQDAIHEIYSYLEAEGITKIALLTDTSGFGASGRGYLISEADLFGLTIVEDETFSTGDPSMEAQVTKIRGSDAQAVVSWATDKESAQVARDMKAQDMTIPLFCSHGVANRAFLESAGDAANGVMFPAGKLLVCDQLPDTDPQKEVLVTYRDAYEALHGAGSSSTFGGHAYDALMMIIMALERLGDDMDGKSLAEARQMLRDEIEKTENFAGTGGIFTMSPTDHLGMAPDPFVMIKVVEGEWTWYQY